MISNHTISGAVFKDMLVTGAALLERNKKTVDSLNVFPVPDGDTGTNMSMTMNTAIRELANADTSTVGSVAVSMAKGALRGARGNSGVILSQIFRGIARAFEGQGEFDAPMLAAALKSGSDHAYKAVMKPKEGTVLTVCRYVAEEAEKRAALGVNVYKLIDSMITDGEEILQRTPEMLPVLKEAGVVDSGGMGFLLVIRGFKMALDGDSIEDYDPNAENKESSAMQSNEESIMVDSLEDIKFAYCTEFFIEHLNEAYVPGDVDTLKEHLQRIGDSVVAVDDSEMVKVHVHTNVPGKALQMALRLGEINGVKIENMKEQHRRLMEERKAREKEYGIVAISVGEGIGNVFKDLAADYIVTGGQTMNPSALDIERAVKRVNARNVFVFPNNKNIIMAAQQAAELVRQSSGMNVVVVPTQSIMQGMAAIIAFDPDGDVKTNADNMLCAGRNVKSGSVTFAVRTTAINGNKIQEGDYIAMVDDHIVENGKNIDDVVDKMVSAMMEDEGEYVTVFYGEDVPEQSAKAFASRIEKAYPDVDVVLQYGGQPLYYYFISVE